MFVKLPTNAGVYKDDTPLKATGFYIDADKIRFVRGVPQTFGGWELVTNSTVTGFCRGIHTWVDGDLLKWLGMGTHTNLYALNDAVLYDITPVASYGLLTNPFTTTLGTATTVSHTAHGRLAGDGVSFSGATAVGGITISGNYTVTSVTSANAYVITTATATAAGPGGGSVKYSYFLPIGLASATFALGYGTGLYSAGTYSSPGTGVPYLRTWSICDYGPNGIFCPRGGKIYEWNTLADTTPNEILQNPTFAAPTGWTAGTGWTVNVSSATATLTSGALSQGAAIDPMSYALLDINVSAYTTGTLTVAYNSVTVATASAVGRFTAEIYGGNAGTSASVTLTGASLTCVLTQVSLTPAAAAMTLTNSPTQNTCVVVTPDKFVMTGGTIEINTGLFNPMHIRWSDIAPNHHTWTPSSTVQAGSWTLAIGSRIVAMRVSNNEILIWTDKALYAGTYTNNTAQPYIFRQIGVNCGAIGANAMTVLGGIAYWLAPNGYFFRYAGGGAEPMQSTIRADVFDHIAFVQQDKIFCAAIAQFQDVLWLYPDSRDATQEVSRYALCDTQEPAPLMGGPPPPNIGVWAPGTDTWTAQADAGIFQYAIGVNAAGQIAYLEKGTTANGGNISWSLETGAYELGTGETLYKVTQFVPDFKSLAGGCTYTPHSYKYAQGPVTAHGPFTITSTTTTLDLLNDPPLGRQISHRFEGNASPAQMRAGNHQMDIEDTGMEF